MVFGALTAALVLTTMLLNLRVYHHSVLAPGPEAILAYIMPWYARPRSVRLAAVSSALPAN